MYFDWSFAVVQFVRLWLTMRSSWWIPYTRNGSPKPRPRWRRGCVTLFWVIKICPPSRKFQLIPSQLSDLFTTKPWRWPEIAYKSRKTNWSPQGKRFSLQKLLPNLPRRAPLSFITWKRKLGGRFKANVNQLALILQKYLCSMSSLACKVSKVFRKFVEYLVKSLSCVHTVISWKLEWHCAISLFWR